MTACPRCGRNHHGVCGIPRSTKARPVTTSKEGALSSPAQRVAASKTKPFRFLPGILAEGKRQEQEVLAKLRRITPETAEYEELVVQYDRLRRAVEQMRSRLG